MKDEFKWQNYEELSVSYFFQQNILMAQLEDWFNSNLNWMAPVQYWLQILLPSKWISPQSHIIQENNTIAYLTTRKVFVDSISCNCPFLFGLFIFTRYFFIKVFKLPFSVELYVPFIALGKWWIKSPTKQGDFPWWFVKDPITPLAQYWVLFLLCSTFSVSSWLGSV